MELFTATSPFANHRSTTVPVWAQNSSLQTRLHMTFTSENYWEVNLLTYLLICTSCTCWLTYWSVKTQYVRDWWRRHRTPRHFVPWADPLQPCNCCWTLYRRWWLQLAWSRSVWRGWTAAHEPRVAPAIFTHLLAANYNCFNSMTRAKLQRQHVHYSVPCK